jgi:hypothetical protein
MLRPRTRLSNQLSVQDFTDHVLGQIEQVFVGGKTVDRLVHERSAH